MCLERTILSVGLTVLCALGSAGCEGGTGDLSGKVTYRGKAVVSGSVTVVGADGLPHVGPIGPDGTYAVSGVPAGPVRIAVMSPNPVDVATARTGRGGAARDGGRGGEAREPPPGAPAAPDPVAAKNWFPLPEEAGDVSRSGLKTMLQRGPNIFDLAIP